MCSSATCKPYAVLPLGKTPQPGEAAPVPAPGARLQAGCGRSGAALGEPRGVCRPRQRRPAPGRCGGDAPHRHPRLPLHFGTGVESPAKSPSENRTLILTPAPPGPLFGGRRGLEWGLRAEQDGLGQRQFLSWMLNQFQCRCGGCCLQVLPRLCLLPSSFGSERTSQSPTQIP